MNFYELVSDDALQPLLTDVDKPARYTGGEVNSIVKEQPVDCRIALAFPDVYEVAESHIGLKILYNIVNQRDDLAAERVYALWPDLERKARAADVPLWSLETRRPLAMFDVIGFTLQYELSYTNMLAMLDHGGVPVRTANRRQGDPFVIGGGAGAYNPELIAPFFDAFLLGDGENAVTEIMDVIASGRKREATREEILHDLGNLEGIYVPSHYDVEYDGMQITSIKAKEGTPKAHLKSKHGTPRVTRTTIADLDAAPYPTRNIVPNVKPVHERVSIEIQRGCSQACRFCQAGMITRPTRQRKASTVLKLAEESLKSSGSNEVGLLSLSAGDYEPINEVLSEFFNRYQDDNISVSLPSMRTETMTPELAAQVATVRKGGFTLAPEAGSERMRDVINKTNKEEDLLNAVRATATAGWTHLKFYFMIGLPTETDEDVDAIALLGERARKEGRKINPKLNVTVSVSTFVPKPHTAFQWERQIDIQETRRKHFRLRERLKRLKINFRYHDPKQSFLEGVMSRADRRVADSLELAMQRGCRFDAWSEWYQHDTWLKIFEETLTPHGIEASDYLDERPESWLQPWDHLDAGILKKFLLRDRKKAYAEATIDDCAFTEHCYACGGCELGDPYKAKSRKQRQETGETLIQLRPVVHSPVETERPSADAIMQEHADRHKRTHDKNSGERSKLRFQYAKLGRAFHMSHLDVKEHILRGLRLAKVPALYSEGFTPRPRVNFSPACPTGIASESEYFDVLCLGFPNERQIAEDLRQALPDGLFIKNVESVDVKALSINEALVSNSYVVTPPDGLDDETLRGQLESFRKKAEVPVSVLRKKKARLLDARASMSDFTMVGPQLHLTVLFGDDGTLKPAEAVGAIWGAQVATKAKIRKVRSDLHDNKHVRPSFRFEGDEAHAVDLTSVSQRAPVSKTPSIQDRGESVVVPYAE